MSEHDVTFPCMGCELRLVVGSPDGEAAAAAARAELERIDAQLSRFRPTSELSRLNADPREPVPASSLLRSAVRAAAWAAQLTDGLLDPTLVGALEHVGYAHSRAGETPASVADALAQAPARRPARPNPASRWREIAVDDAAGTITRPPGVAIDSGGVGKGLAADLVATRLAGHVRFAVDAAGDLRVGGSGAVARPHEIEIVHPWEEAPIGTLRIADGAVATSGVGSRLWAKEDGGYAHHLLDPATGLPAWTGVISATALAPTALAAETLAKAALLSGPLGARRWLGEHGGVIVHDDGAPEWIGAARPQRPRPRVRIVLPREPSTSGGAA